MDFSRVHRYHPGNVIAFPFSILPVVIPFFFHGPIALSFDHIHAYFGSAEIAQQSDIHFTISQYLYTHEPLNATLLGLAIGSIICLIHRQILRGNADILAQSALCPKSELKRNRMLRNLRRQAFLVYLIILGSGGALCITFQMGFVNFVIGVGLSIPLFYSGQRDFYEEMLSRIESAPEGGRAALVAVQRKAWCGMLLLWVFWIIPLTALSAYTFSGLSEDFRGIIVVDNAIHGTDMQAREAEEAEEKLARDPKDIDTRAALLGYYTNQTSSPEAQKARARHASWVVENLGDSLLARTWFVREAETQSN